MQKCQCWLYMVCLLALSLTTKAQGTVTSPYQIKTGIEAPLLGAGVVGLGLGYFLHNAKPLLTEAEVNALDVNDMWNFRLDRWPTQTWSTPSQHASDYLMYGANALPLLFLADPTIRKDYKAASFIVLETYMINAALTTITKELVQRKRPFVYNANAPMSLKMSADATSSFFSGHTSSTAAACFVTAKMYTDYHPNSSYNYLVWGSAALVPAVMGYLRMKGGKHYFTDVLVGYAVGALVGVVVPTLHKKLP